MEIKSIVSSIGAPALAAIVGSVATADGTQSKWYRKLRKPSYQPPAEVFPVAWTALYTSVAIGSIDAQRKMTDDEKRAYRRKLALNMALNAGWCWTFFQGQKLGPSVVVAGALAASSADLARTAGSASTRAGLTVTPYALWTGFATVLSSGIWDLNRSK